MPTQWFEWKQGESERKKKISDGIQNQPNELIQTNASCVCACNIFFYFFNLYLHEQHGVEDERFTNVLIYRYAIKSNSNIGPDIIGHLSIYCYFFFSSFVCLKEWLYV